MCLGEGGGAAAATAVLKERTRIFLFHEDNETVRLAWHKVGRVEKVRYVHEAKG